MSKAYFIHGIRDVFQVFKRRLVLSIVNFLALGPVYRPLQDLRKYLLSSLRLEIGDSCQFSEQLFVLNQGNLTIGGGSRIGTHCRIYNFSPIRIGQNFLCSHGTTIISGSHDTKDLSDIQGEVTIGDNVWIGINVTIVGPVTIGNNAVIGAGALVIRDIPDNAIVAGVPAKLIRYKTVEP